MHLTPALMTIKAIAQAMLEQDLGRNWERTPGKEMDPGSAQRRPFLLELATAKRPDRRIPKVLDGRAGKAGCFCAC